MPGSELKPISEKSEPITREVNRPPVSAKQLDLMPKGPYRVAEMEDAFRNTTGRVL